MRYYFFILAVLLLFHTNSQTVLLTPLLPASAFQNEFYQVRFRVRNLVGARFQFKNVPSFFTVSSEGLISGVPTKKGLYPIEVTFFNDTYRDTKEVIIEVRRGTKLQQYNSESQQSLVLQQNKLKVKQEYQFTYNEGDELSIDIRISDGVSPYRYEVIYMPGELQFNNKTGGISGVFVKYGEYVLGVRVKDSRNSQVQVLIKVIVNMKNIMGSAVSSSTSNSNNNNNNSNNNKLIFRQRSLIELSFLKNNNNNSNSSKSTNTNTGTNTNGNSNSNGNGNNITSNSNTNNVENTNTNTKPSTITPTTTGTSTSPSSTVIPNNIPVNTNSNLQSSKSDTVNTVSKQPNSNNNNLGTTTTGTQGGAINIINNTTSNTPSQNTINYNNNQQKEPTNNNKPNNNQPSTTATTISTTITNTNQPIIPQQISKSAQSDKKSTQIIPTQNIINKNITTINETINLQQIQQQKNLLNTKLQLSKTQLKLCYDNVSTYRTTLDNLLNSYNQQFNKVDTLKNQLQQLKTKSQRITTDLTQKIDKLKIFLTQKTSAEQQFNRSLSSYQNVNYAYNGSLTNINKNLQDINKKQQQIEHHKKQLDSLYKVLDQTLTSNNQLEQHKNQLNQQIKNGIGLTYHIDTTKVNFGGCENHQFHQKSIGVGQIKKSIDKTYLLTNNHFITFGDCTEHTIAKPGDFIQWKGYLWKGSVSALTIKKIK